MSCSLTCRDESVASKSSKTKVVTIRHNDNLNNTNYIFKCSNRITEAQALSNLILIE